MSSFKLPSIPGDFSWLNTPVSYRIDPDGSLSIRCKDRTDWFTDPIAGYGNRSAPVALFEPPDEVFNLSARVRGGFSLPADSGTLFVHVRDDPWSVDDKWARLCIECADLVKPWLPSLEPRGGSDRSSITSVVTRGGSDRANGPGIDGFEVWLRVTRNGSAFYFDYSTDGKQWDNVREFALDLPGWGYERVRVGFSVQSSIGLGDGCEATFSEISYRAGEPEDYKWE